MNLPTAQWRWDTAEQGGFLSAAEEDRLADVAGRLAPEHDTFSGFVSAVNAEMDLNIDPDDNLLAEAWASAHGDDDD